ncbi:MAG: hypothetical protein AABX00_02215 [Nanoarchaeota archaeon]
MKNLKEKIIGATGSVSGAASVLGSWQICHSVCLGIIALLGLIGITIIGMPLEFLTRIAIPMWTIAVLLLITTFILYKTKKCISKNMVIMNTGIIIAGTPFAQVQQFSIFFWFFGGLIAAYGIFLMIKERREMKCHEN